MRRLRMGLAGVHRLPGLTLAMLATSCSPYYSFLPRVLTYEVAEGRPAESPPPDPVAIATADLRSIFGAGDPHDVSVAAPRRDPRGWSFCLAAKVANST